MFGAAWSPNRRLSFSDGVTGDLRKAVDDILVRVTEAQRRSDLILLNCLNEKLPLVRGLLLIAEDGALNLREAIARENLDLQEHNFRKVAVAEDQARTLLIQVDGCVGDGRSNRDGVTELEAYLDGAALGPQWLRQVEADEDFGPPVQSSTRPPDSSPDG
jgi:hypothetical protein